MSDDDNKAVEVVNEAQNEEVVVSSENVELEAVEDIEESTNIEVDNNDAPPLAKHQTDAVIKVNDDDKNDDESKENSKTEKEEEKKKSAVSFTQLYKYANTFDSVMLFVGVICCLAQGMAYPLFSIIFGDLLDSLASDDVVARVTKDVFNFIYIGLGTFVVSGLGLACMMYTAESIAHKIRIKFLASVMSQETAFFESYKQGELNTMLDKNTIDFAKGAGEKLSIQIQNVGTCIAGMAVGFAYGWQLSLFLLGCVPVMALSIHLLAGGIEDMSVQKQEAYAKAGAVATESLGAVKTVVSLGMSNQVQKYYASFLQTSHDMGTQIANGMGRGAGAMQFIMYCMYGFTFYFGAFLIQEGVENSRTGENYTGGDIMTVFFAFIIGAMGLGQVGTLQTNILTSQSAAYALYEVIDRVPAINATDTETGDKLSDEEFQGNVSLKNIQFRYPSRPDNPVFNDFSVDVKKGQKVAFVGESGSGKSTIIALLQRLYDPEAGVVLLDGHPLPELNVCWLREQLGVVSQEPVLFQGSIKENLLLGKPDATQDEIEKCCRLAEAHDFIMSLGGYESDVGEGGSKLSGGQKQRVGIARALLKKPKMLLLDEATSALDNETEQAVQAALDEVMQGGTTFIVAHRLTTVKNADKIFVLQNGEIVEDGTHNELVAKQGVYAALASTQLQSSDTHGLEYKQHVMEQKVAHDKHVAARKKWASKRNAESEVKTEDGKEEKKEAEKVVDNVPFSRVYGLLNSKSRLTMYGGIIAASISGAAQPFFAFAFGELTEVFYEPDGNKQLDLALFWGLIFLAIGFVVGTCDYLKLSLLGRVGEDLTREIRERSMAAYLRQEMGFFDEPDHLSHKLANQLSTLASKVHGGTINTIAYTCQLTIALSAGLILAVWYSWILTLVVLGTVPFMTVASIVQMKTLSGFTDAKKMNEPTKVSGMAIEHINTVSAFVSGTAMVTKYEQALQQPFSDSISGSYWAGFGFGFGNGMMFMVYAVCFYVGALLVGDGDISLAGLLKVVFGVMMAGFVAGEVSNYLPDMTEAVKAKNAIFELLDRKSKIDPTHKGGLKTQFTKGGAITVKNVHFAYPTKPDVPVLKDFSVHIPAGSTLALSGTSGHGKSTIVGLIQRFYDPTVAVVKSADVADDGESLEQRFYGSNVQLDEEEGAPSSGVILIDDVDISKMNVQTLRSQIGWVKQDPFLFDGSIRDNVRFSYPKATNADIEAALKLANAWDFVQNLQDKLDTQVGAKGSQLSGGQKQRIAIARALVRKPKILLLDEATSALDAESERVVQEALDKIMAQKTMTIILIAHRMNTIANADQIAVVENGHVVEIGNHETLMTRKGKYYTLAAMSNQAS